jgi:hypothetical protein
MIGFQPTRTITWGMGVSVALLIFFIFLAGVAIFYGSSIDFPHMDKGLDLFHDDQCERPRDHSWIVELQNTLSNAGYALAGTLILLRAGTWAGHLFGANLLILGLMSALYHATLSHEMPQVLDVAWVYAALLALSVYASYVLIQRRQPLTIPSLAVYISGSVWVLVGLIITLLYGGEGFAAFASLSVFVIGAGFLCFLFDRFLPALGWTIGLIVILGVGIPAFGLLIKLKLHWNSDPVFAILIVLLILQLVYLFAGAKKLDWGRLAWELPVIVTPLIIGLVCRLGDGYNVTGKGETRIVARKFLCDPDGFFQAHAHWHLLGAVALLLGYDLLSQFQTRRGKDSDKAVIFPDSSVEQS